MKKTFYILSIATLLAAAATLASCSADDKGLDEFSTKEIVEELEQRRIPDVMLDSLKGAVRIMEVVTYKESSWDSQTNKPIKGVPDTKLVYEYDNSGFKTLTSHGYDMVSEAKVMENSLLNLQVVKLAYVPSVSHKCAYDQRHRPTLKEMVEQSARFEIKDQASQVQTLAQGHYVGEVLTFTTAFNATVVGKLVRDTAAYTKEEYFYNDVAKVVSVIFSESTDKGITFVQMLKRVHPQDSLGMANMNSYDEYKPQATPAAFEGTPSNSHNVVIEKDKMGNILSSYSKTTAQGVVTIANYKEYKYTYY